MLFFLLFAHSDLSRTEISSSQHINISNSWQEVNQNYFYWSTILDKSKHAQICDNSLVVTLNALFHIDYVAFLLMHFSDGLIIWEDFIICEHNVKLSYTKQFYQLYLLTTRKLRTQLASRILIGFSAAMAMMLVLFLGGMDQVADPVICLLYLVPSIFACL